MIVKIILRDQVRELLITKMYSGELKIGQTLSLAGIARELDVSVTPIREALTQLQSVRIVEAIPNKGFVIPELNRKEAKELYELVSYLEAMALENSEIKENTVIKLRKQQDIFKKTTKPYSRVNADMKFHEILTSEYKNNTAKSILSDLKVRIFFYEISFMEKHGLQKNSNNHHESIINHLENGQKSEAIEILKKNWLQILKFI